MNSDRHSKADPEVSSGAGDAALPGAGEDSGEAGGPGHEQRATDRVFGQRQGPLAAASSPAKSAGFLPDSQVQPKDAARPRRFWLFISGTLGLAAALLLFVNLQPTPEETRAIEPGDSASGFAAAIKVIDEPIPGAPAGTPHQVKVNVTANSDGFIALFRQSGDGGPAFVANLEYQKDQGSMHVLQEDAASGTRYCILGARDQEGLKHLLELIAELWAYLPTMSCYSVR